MMKNKIKAFPANGHNRFSFGVQKREKNNTKMPLSCSLSVCYLRVNSYDKTKEELDLFRVCYLVKKCTFTVR